jgi:hypothetical protein
MAKQESFLIKLFQGIAVALILGVIYLNLDIRDFMKYKQPLIDTQQNTYIKDVQRQIAISDSMTSYKVSNCNLRINDFKDDVAEMKKDITFIKNFIIGKNNLANK